MKYPVINLNGNPDLGLFIQKELFKLGYKWLCGGTTPLLNHGHAIGISCDNYLFYATVESYKTDNTYEVYTSIDGFLNAARRVNTTTISLNNDYKVEINNQGVSIFNGINIVCNFGFNVVEQLVKAKLTKQKNMTKFVFDTKHNKDLSRYIQAELFKLGFGWPQKSHINHSSSCLWLDEGWLITHSTVTYARNQGREIITSVDTYWEKVKNFIDSITNTVVKLTNEYSVKFNNDNTITVGCQTFNDSVINDIAFAVTKYK